MKKTFMLLLVAFAIATIASAQTAPTPPKNPQPFALNPSDMPPPPPPPDQPPAPPPPPPPIKGQSIQVTNDHQDFFKRNPSVGSVNWEDGSVSIIQKNGKEERYDLNKQGIKKAEAKYGKLPATPPPPQPPTPPQPPKM